MHLWALVKLMAPKIWKGIKKGEDGREGEKDEWRKFGSPQFLGVGEHRKLTKRRLHKKEA